MAFINYSKFFTASCRHQQTSSNYRQFKFILHVVRNRDYGPVGSTNLQQQNLQKKKKNLKLFHVTSFAFPHFPSKMMPYIVNILHLGRVFLEINSFHLLCTPHHFALWVCLVQVALSNGRHLLFGVYWLNIRGQTSVQELASGSNSRLHGNYRINNQLRRFMTNPLKISFSVFI